MPASSEFVREEIEHIRQGEKEAVVQRNPTRTSRSPDARRARVTGATRHEAKVDHDGAPLHRRAGRAIRGH